MFLERPPSANLQRPAKAEVTLNTGSHFQVPTEAEGKLDREEVLSMMNEIMSKTAGFAHIVATEGDVQYLMATCDEDGATRPCRAALAACGGCSRAVGARGGRRFRRLPQGERGEKDA